MKLQPNKSWVHLKDLFQSPFKPLTTAISNKFYYKNNFTKTTNSHHISQHKLFPYFIQHQLLSITDNSFHHKISLPTQIHMQIPSSKEQIKTDCQNQNPKLPHFIKQSKTNTLIQHNYQTQQNRQHQLTDQTNSQIQFLKISKKEQPQKTNFTFSHFSSPLINKKHDQHTPTTKQHTQPKHSNNTKNSDQKNRHKFSSHTKQNANHSFHLQRIIKSNSNRQQKATRNLMIAHRTALSISRNFIFLFDTTKTKKRV